MSEDEARVLAGDAGAPLGDLLPGRDRVETVRLLVGDDKVTVLDVDAVRLVRGEQALALAELLALRHEVHLHLVAPAVLDIDHRVAHQLAVGLLLHLLLEHVVKDALLFAGLGAAEAHRLRLVQRGVQVHELVVAVDALLTERGAREVDVRRVRTPDDLARAVRVVA